MKKLLVVLIPILAVCCGRKTWSLQNGDLIFVGIPADYQAEAGSMDTAIDYKLFR